MPGPESSGGAILIGETALPENELWWTNVDRLQDRQFSTTLALEPIIPETKRYSYTITAPVTTDYSPGTSQPSGASTSEMEESPVFNKPDPEGSVSTYDGLFDSDMDNLHKPAPAPSTRLRTDSHRERWQRRRSEWQREFNLGYEWKDSWTDYRLHSTIHGVKHAAEPQLFTVRRVFWALLVMGLAAVFIYLITLAIRIYFTWPVVLHVNTVYKTNIRYPAVTICNQNTFRVTASVDNNWYDLLNLVYSDDVQSYNRLKYTAETNVSLFDIYTTTAHTMENMIKQCTWDGRPCSPEAFQPVLTDYGMCYTFNSGHDGATRYATHTGAGSGLTLLLNLEQYEYMAGPHAGAGIKILLHNQEEFPLLEHQGVTLPKGSHTFMALKYMTTKYLPPPYGDCDDTKELQLYNLYARSACIDECKQLYIQLNCHCRNYYMQYEEQYINNTSPPCTLYDYDSCVRNLEERFWRIQAGFCDCPNPCTQRTYQIQTSVGAVSNFEVLDMVASGQAESMEDTVVTAKKVTEKVFSKTPDADTELIRQFIESVENIERALRILLSNLVQAQNRWDYMLQEMNYRTWFHENGGFIRMSSYLENAFSRGWNSYKERSLDVMATGIYAIGDTYNMIMNKVDDEDIEQTSRETMWLVLDNQLRERVELSKKSVGFINEAYRAFLTGEPLNKGYQETFKGHFDKSFIDVDLLASDISSNEVAAEWTKDKLLDHIEDIRRVVNIMSRYGNNYFSRDIDFTADEVNIIAEEFVSATRSYISRLAAFERRIVANLQDTIERQLETFHFVNRTFGKSHSDLTLMISTIHNLIGDFNSTVWRDIMEKSERSQLYLDNKITQKEELAKELTSKALRDKMGSFNIFFNAIRARGRDLVDRWMMLMVSYESIWKSILEESLLQPFYSMVQSTFLTYKDAVLTENTDLIDEFDNILADLLMIPAYQLRRMDLDIAEVLLNADVSDMDTDEKTEEVQNIFQNFINMTDVMGILGDLDVGFQQAFDQYEYSMEQFVQASQMNEQFYLDNIMGVDIYMQDVNTEEIVHQPAYDYVHLVGDVGGLLSLLLGASIISVIELLDLGIHHLFKWIMAHDLNKDH